MSTEKQIAANQANAQHSTGPKSDSGKAAIAHNNFRHGLTCGIFALLAWENHDEFQTLLADLESEHQPVTPTERVLVEKMAQSCWLRKRALLLQDLCFHDTTPICNPGQEKDLALYVRYQTTHDRAFHAALNALLKLRAEKRKAEIGFESQKQKEAVAQHRQNAETRKQELHQWAVLLAEAKVERQQALPSNAKPPKSIHASEQKRPLEAQQAA